MSTRETRVSTVVDDCLRVHARFSGSDVELLLQNDRLRDAYQGVIETHFPAESLRFDDKSELLTETRATEVIVQLVCKQLGTTAERVKPETLFERDLLADSLDLIELFMNFETTFGVSTSEEEERVVKTVCDLVKLLKTKGKI
ncbi:acyl carrier protein [Oligoflexia bacterium]|nr:acyl carrier protein [Oligoflexia bacterium]